MEQGQWDTDSKLWSSLFTGQTLHPLPVYQTSIFSMRLFCVISNWSGKNLPYRLSVSPLGKIHLIPIFDQIFQVLKHKSF